MLPAPGEPLIRVDAAPGLFLSRAGTWYEDGEAVTHPRLAALLTRCIARGEGGALVVTTGRDVRPMTAEDCPHHVRALDVQPDGARLLLHDGTSEPLPPGARVLIDREGRMRAPVKQGRFWALFTRPAAHQVAALLVDEGARIALPAGFALLVVDDAPRDWSAPPSSDDEAGLSAP